MNFAESFNFDLKHANGKANQRCSLYCVLHTVQQLQHDIFLLNRDGLDNVVVILGDKEEAIALSTLICRHSVACSLIRFKDLSHVVHR